MAVQLVTSVTSVIISSTMLQYSYCSYITNTNRFSYKL